GQGERALVPAAEPRHRERDRAEDPREARHRCGREGRRGARERRVARRQARRPQGVGRVEPAKETPMDETDGRLAPVSYLFGARPSASSAPARDDIHEHDIDDDTDDGELNEPEWNDAWASDVDDSCARLSDADRERAAAAERI